MTSKTEIQRCRIVLTLDTGRAISTDLMERLVEAGDIATVILYNSQNDDVAFQKAAEGLIGPIQQRGIAVIIAGDSRVAGRIKADGLHIESKQDELADAIERHRQSMMIGFGNLRDRHTALAVGEMEPDYVMFGKLGADNKAEPHPRNISLGEWWASMVEVPCIVQAGSDLESIIQVARTGAEFVAVEEAVLATADMPYALGEANRLLDEYAPVIGDYEE